MSDWTLAGTSTVTLPPASTDGVSRPIVLSGAQQTSLEGALTTQILSRKRSYTLNFGVLSDTDYDLLLQFVDGRQGLGPFTLADPRDPSGVTHLVNLVLPSPLTDDSPRSDVRGAVSLALLEV